MSPPSYPLITIGAGAGGLVTAIGYAKAGKRSLLIEKGLYGGDCTNYGCVPSKALLASSHTARGAEEARSFAPSSSPSPIHGHEVFQRVRRIVEEIREHEEPAALAKIGVNTLNGEAHFLDTHTLRVTDKEGNSREVRGEQIVIATGSAPFIPSIPGLQETPFLTNETLFSLLTLPSSLAIMGGGPIGCEMAQAFQRLGCQVTLIETHNALLNRNEPEAQALLLKTLQKEGVHILLEHSVTRVNSSPDGVSLTLKGPHCEEVRAERLLVATGRRPNHSSLQLEKAGIALCEGAIQVDRYGRTRRKHIWAIGDVTGGMPFTHVAESEGRTVLTNLLLPFPFKKKLYRGLAIPHCTYTDPEVAAIGLSEVEALQQYGSRKIAVYHFPFEKLDRALTSGRTEGFVKVITKKWSSKILGATIVAPCGGELISEIATAMEHNLPLRKLASVIHAYPTYSLAIRKTADLWLTQTLLPSIKKWVGKA